MNHLLEINKLNNHYYAFRHGESISNVKKLIISSPKNGISKYGLSENGINQVKKSIGNCSFAFDYKTIIYSSDFKRTKETAEIIAEIIESKNLFFDKKIRERFFGDFEEKSNINYSKIWEKDIKNPCHKEYNVESVEEVLERVSKFIIEIDTLYENKNIIVTSHGDTLQILQIAFNKMLTLKLRSFPHMHNAEIKKLTLKK